MNKKIAIISNILSPHMIPLCEFFYSYQKDFVFIQTQDCGESWTLKGEITNFNDYPYLISYNQNKEKCNSILNNYDVVISGVGLELLKNRLRKRKMTFVYLERFYRSGITPRRILGTFLHHNLYQKYKPILLCTGAYCSGDASVFGNYRNRCYKWGYFPRFIDADINKLEAKKEKQILWAGRMISLKHPDDFISSMKTVLTNNPSYKAILCGGGPLLENLKSGIKGTSYEEKIIFLGNVSNDKLREEMEKSEIFVFTSDYNEGWGAVINEAMNAGCCVISSHACGAAPFLIKHGKSGLIYESGNVSNLISNIAYAIENESASRAIRHNAYLQIKDFWNANVAGSRLINLIGLLNANKPTTYCDGPCSKAFPIKQKNMLKEVFK